MSRHSFFEACAPVHQLDHEAMELTFQLLRNSRPLLAFLIKNALTELRLKDRESNRNHVFDQVSPADLVGLLGTVNLIQIVGSLNEIAQEALLKKDLPPIRQRQLRELIEAWVRVAEWILENNSFDQTAYH